MWDRDALWWGLVIGLVTPFVSYAIILMIYDQLDAAGITDALSMGNSYRERTVGLMAIAANIIPINIFKRKYQDNNMRGIVLATLIYVVAWVVLYAKYLF